MALLSHQRLTAGELRAAIFVPRSLAVIILFGRERERAKAIIRLVDIHTNLPRYT